MTQAVSKLEIPKRLLVIAPHPDDATIASGLIQRVRSTGGSVLTVNLTSGDAYSHFTNKFLENIGFRESRDPKINAALYREMEEKKSHEILGGTSGDLQFLKFGDGELEALNEGPLRVQLLEKLCSIVSDFNPDALTCPHPNDHHSDHAAAYLFSVDAVKRTGRVASCKILCYLDHFAYPFPQSLIPDQMVRPTMPFGPIPSPTRWSEILLTPEEIATKIRAIGVFQSQMAWEHPLWNPKNKPYPEFKSYLYGWVSQNEVYGTVETYVYSSAFRRKVNRWVYRSRVKLFMKNLVRELIHS